MSKYTRLARSLCRWGQASEDVEGLDGQQLANDDVTIVAKVLVGPSARPQKDAQASEDVEEHEGHELARGRSRSR